jgi:hypothetical protein
LHRDRIVSSRGWSAESDQENAYFGLAINSAGDVNNDGYGDVIVGSHLYDAPDVNEGKAFLYLGSAEGLGTTPAWTVEGNQAGAFLGSSIASAGDVNNDGHDDVIVGLSRYDVLGDDEGRVELYLGTASGLQATPHWTKNGSQAGARFGSKVAAAGDVNNDGFDDVIVSERFYDGGQSDEGRVHVFLGSGSGLEDDPVWTFESDQAGATLYAVGTAGDVNGDTYGDIVISSPLFDNGQTDEGRVWIFLGQEVGFSPIPIVLEIDVTAARFGFSAGTAGDVNGDSHPDIVVGAWGYTNGETEEGAVFLFLGTGTGVSVAPAWSFESNQEYAHLGFAASAAGNVNGDPYDDVVFGAGDYDSTRTDEGAVWVFVGSESGPSATPTWHRPGHQALGSFGWSAATAGDVNGDGLDDVIVGAWSQHNGEANEGRAHVFHGPLVSDCP